jgi:predicted  nucleic acid-binding Zn-ribbon protein
MNFSKNGIKLTNEQFEIKLKLINLEKVDEYVNSRTSIRYKCTLCGRIHTKKPKEINKLICQCVDKPKSFQDGNVICLEVYKNVRTKIKFQCLKCNYIYTSTPRTQKNSIHGCPSCSGKKFSEEKYKSLLPVNIILDDVYDGCLKKTKHICTDCNKSWITKPNYIIHGKCGCPHCPSSKGEKEIIRVLDRLEIKYKHIKPVKINDKTYLFDFHLEDLNSFIEFDGQQHFKAIDYFGGEKQYKIILKNDNIKNTYCSGNNIKLLRIPYDKYNDIENLIINFIING